MREVVGQLPGVAHWVQFQAERDGLLPGAAWVKDFTAGIKGAYLRSLLTGSVRRARRRVGPRDGALVIFTTGSTGSPKAALLCHQGVLAQNVALTVGFGLREDDRLLVNLPPSHVGCATELLGTAVHMGVTAVLIQIFDAERSLEAIAQHRATVLGQIPALFNLEWNHRRYAELDLSARAHGHLRRPGRCRCRSWRSCGPWRRTSAPGSASPRPPASAPTPPPTPAWTSLAGRHRPRPRRSAP